jgi:hypothetical protein
MPRHTPATVRILPMSDKLPGFRGRSIADVQAKCFLRDLPRVNGRFHYPSVGLDAEPGTIVLFQYRARIIASATFLRDEKFDRPRRGCAGALHFDPSSFRTFDPVDVEGMRKAWPSFRAFGHVRQYLHPLRYPIFKRRLKQVMAPRVTSPRP